MTLFKSIAVSLATLLALAMAAPGMAQASAPAAPLAQAISAHHLYRVELLAAPNPLPLQKYFELQLAVFDANPSGGRITNGKVDVTLGMTHGTGHEFMHGMQSSPVVEAHQGIYLVRGVFLHMEGPWTVRVHVQQGEKSDTADLVVNCCGG